MPDIIHISPRSTALWKAVFLRHSRLNGALTDISWSSADLQPARILAK